jgi:hypothetical protein
MEPLNILLNFFDREVCVYLKTGKIIAGRFIKYCRIAEDEAEWYFLEKENFQKFLTLSDLHFAILIPHKHIESVKINENETLC